MNWSLLFFSLIVFVHIDVFADYSTKTLVKGTSQAPLDSGLQSGRYQVKTREPSDEFEIKLKPIKKSKRKGDKRPASEGDIIPAKPEEISGMEIDKNSLQPTEDPSFTEHVKSLFSGKENSEIESYKEQVHPDDVRLNRVEIMVKPSIIYNGSTSNFSYRNYSSFATHVGLGAGVWPTHAFGIFGYYSTSLGQDISANSSSGSRVAVKAEKTELNLDYRKYFGLSRRSNSLTVGLHYNEYRLSPPSDETTRVGLKTSGVGMHLKARIPTAPSYSWLIGATISPRLQHAELSTALTMKSGSSPESSRIGFNFGGEIKFSRESILEWGLSTEIERNQFAGSSSISDPERGTPVSGVTVTNTTTSLGLSYRWGQ